MFTVSLCRRVNLYAFLKVMHAALHKPWQEEICMAGYKKDESIGDDVH
jgi:hypothetical protein